MPQITTDAKREIITDFAKSIREKKTSGSKPAHDVINFRQEKILGIERPIELVPVELLRYRRDNGRIASDVMNYEKIFGPLDEKDAEAQQIIQKFLEEKDPEKTDILIKSMEHGGQSDAAIITCDGFLINGNRRKMVFEKLRKQYPGRTEFHFMKVVILPGADDEGGPPTLLEIERLENRYQLQSEGKSEYYGFDRALSIKRKMKLGFSLEEQLKDDPRYVKAAAKELLQAVRETEKDYLRPLECVDRYLRFFKREGLYGNISSGPSDPEGRWQAFIDYSGAYQRYFCSRPWMIEKGIDEDEIGAIEDAAFKVIKLRDLPGLPKPHKIMRDFPKLCALKHSRKELIRISDDVETTVPPRECLDEKHEPLPIEQIDQKWVERNRQDVIYHLKKALEFHEAHQNKETPLTLLEAAYKKLTHDNMQVESIAVSDLGKARQFTADIQRVGKQLEAEIYHAKKKFDQLGTKK